MLDSVTKLTLICLLIFTPVALGSVELWAFSLMELGILLMIVLWAIQSATGNAARGIRTSVADTTTYSHSESILMLGSVHNSQFTIPFICLFFFLGIVLFQMVPLPAGIIKVISPRTFVLREYLTFDLSALSPGRTPNPSALSFPLSFVPFLTKVEFFKWLTLIGFFLFLLNWSYSGKTVKQIIIVIMLVGIFEALYGMFEFFSGHRHIFGLAIEDAMSGVTGTFVNRNYFAGYLLMVIPLSVGYFFSREAFQMRRSMGWRERLSSLNGKTVLIGFGIVLMILGLIFSGSRMGIGSLLLSFTVISLMFRNQDRERRFSRISVFILGLAILWAVWIGLDAVISRFFATSEDFKSRWTIWMDTFQIFKDSPLFGSGLGTWVSVFPLYRSFHLRGLRTHAENDYVQLASEIGLIGTGLLLITLLFLLYKSIVGIRSLSSRDQGKYIGTGSLVGILALMFHSIVERNIQVPSNAFLFTFIFALILRVGVNKNREK